MSEITLPSKDDYPAMDRLGQAALDVCLPVLKAHWNAGGSASMNPSLDYLAVNMGRAIIDALAKDPTP